MLFGVVLWATGPAAVAMGLGTASLESSLGEPLRLSIPVTQRSDEDVGCIQVRARGDDLPAVFNTRSNVVRQGSQTRIEISSAQKVVEPTVGLVVSVGCSSPVSREFVLFLDPPLVAPALATGDETPRSIVEPTIPRRMTRAGPRRSYSPQTQPAVPAARAPRAKVSPDAQAIAPVRKPRPPRSVPTAPSPSASPIVKEAAPPAATVPPPVSPPQAAAPVVGKGDRLSIAPQVQAPAVQPTVPPGVVAPPTGTDGTAAPGVQAATGPAAPGTAASVAAANASADVEMMAREQALRQQRDALQARIGTLSEQIAALRAQTASLTTRNQALEDSTISPLWFWLLAALALVALIAAAWMARSYLQLKRSVEGSDWWAHTQASQMAPAADEEDRRDDDLPALDSGTRMSSIGRTTKTDSRTSHVMAAAPVVSNVERSRPVARTPNYPPAIETDFTVSDIEVAMATVRTVSPPRTQQPVLTDSDLGHLGGPTEPRPYSDPPPSAPAAAVPRAGAPAGRGPFPTDHGGDTVTVPDLNVPPMDVAATSTRAPVPEPEPPESLDFKLDIPESYDPLATDSFKRTEFDRTSPSRTPDFDTAPPPTSLDLELPTASAIDSRVASDIGARHGATALDNLFATTDSTGKFGADTILNLDERESSALSASDVGRFTSTAIDNPTGESRATVQGRMSRFADLMNQVDEAAATDPLRAIALLRQYVLRDENIPTILWLRLFELYKSVGKKQVYDALAEHFARRYHRPMVGWNETLADRVPQTPLSAFKELDSQIEASWGMEIGLDRLQTLLCDQDQSDAIIFNAVLQRDLLDAAKIFLLDRDSSISPDRG